MSTKALPSHPCRGRILGLASLLGAALGGCAGEPQQSSAGHFADLHFRSPAAAVASPLDRAAPPGRGPAGEVASAPALRPRMAAPVEPGPVLAVAPETAAARIGAYLDHAGFALEQRPEGAGRLMSATRMGAPQALLSEAVCGLEALHRPDIASTELSVRLTPAPGGVQVETSVRFVEVDTRLLSGTLARQTCRSRGVLEAAIRRAALAG